MRESRAPATSPHPRGEAARVAIEALSVSVIGFCLALAANRLSPRGLSLTRDYFPAGTPVTATHVTAEPPSARNKEAPAATAPSTDDVAARLAAKGLRFIDSAEAFRLFRDPRHLEELVIFVDARNDAHFQEGHIPGAYGFDHYYPENALPLVLPACQQAETIVVYCGGGDCEDSEFAALSLRDAGIPAERLGVYGGGFADWQTNGRPVEVGLRGSGNLQTTPP